MDKLRVEADCWVLLDGEDWADGHAKAPKEKREELEGDPEEGDEILKRMLQTKPKQHKDMVAERKGKRGQPKKGRAAQ